MPQLSLLVVSFRYATTADAIAIPTPKVMRMEGGMAAEGYEDEIMGTLIAVGSVHSILVVVD